MTKATVRRSELKQKVEARKKRIAAVKTMEKAKKDRAKQLAGAKAQFKKDVKNVKKIAGKTYRATKRVARVGGKVMKRADGFASKLLGGFKW